MCCHCAGENAGLDQNLKKMYKIVLSICHDCRADSLNPVYQLEHARKENRHFHSIDWFQVKQTMKLQYNQLHNFN